MKRIFYIIIFTLLVTSCKKFLDVKPETQVDIDELFSSERGFKEALNGIYTRCTYGSLYGGNLTFNMLDVLAQNYQFNDVTYQAIANFDFRNNSLRYMCNEVWGASFSAISNCNYILQYIDKDPGMFSAGYHDLIKGEALALRAYLHYDLLRMFAPSFVSGASQKAIPYVTRTGTISTPFYTVGAVTDSILRDLNNAKELLKADPIISKSYVVGYPGEKGITEADATDLFMQNRRHRLNYYAVCGELARVYLGKKDYTNAKLNAEEVIKADKFPFVKQDDFFKTDPLLRDRIMYPELVAGWYVDNTDIYSTLQGRFTNQNPQYSATVSQIGDIYEIGKSGADDWRLKQWFLNTAATTGGQDRAVLQKYYKNASPLTNRHPLMAPAIRLSEMYYIAAEASWDTDPKVAVNYFNTIRAKRGIGDTVSEGISKDDFIELLLGEARKEFYGESQLFFMYKRLHHGVRISVTNIKPASNSIFVLPIPDDENAYRNN
ncbi:RagB/SusD family nutrient uptake outer membrane protein [Chitinophaga silvatica]|uniref:RagB/SusD family nutrient uptake outer membrane protein n=1 Tax=Chitinophaga silvatica TaxID=2282649 RepID=A0A3E1Y6Z9_9BACT|nr:RagB/SusD family nutrient uptake outer membrane protein [Chitinophaga silvatica]RFS20668.1 RagB/SusD family nutrient uptake outer membrane protein [Chitinophaga silvatica]